MISESSNAKNVANFGSLISFCTAYGSIYNPVNPGIILTALQTKHAAAATTLAGVSTAHSTWTDAVSNREIAFEPLNVIVIRVVSAVASAGISGQALADVKTITNKLLGRRAKSIKEGDPGNPPPQGGETPKHISVSQLSYDNRIDNLSRLIDFLTVLTSYEPNETELAVQGLTTLLNKLKASNTTVVDAYTHLSNARIERNDVMYAANTGLVDISLEVKLYVKSLFGTTSPQYKQLTSLKFTRPRE